YPDMREHGWPADDWPDVVWPKVRDADILVIGTPIWLGEPSSVARRLIERLYAKGNEPNAKGQSAYYRKVAATVTPGNEAGVRDAAGQLPYARRDMGLAIPPSAQAGWIGAIGPGPSYLDEGSGGRENEYTTKLLTYATGNLPHFE